MRACTRVWLSQGSVPCAWATKRVFRAMTRTLSAGKEGMIPCEIQLGMFLFLGGHEPCHSRTLDSLGVVNPVSLIVAYRTVQANARWDWSYSSDRFPQARFEKSRVSSTTSFVRSE